MKGGRLCPPRTDRGYGRGGTAGDPFHLRNGNPSGAAMKDSGNYLPKSGGSCGKNGEDKKSAGDIRQSEEGIPTGLESKKSASAEGKGSMDEFHG